MGSGPRAADLFTEGGDFARQGAAAAARAGLFSRPMDGGLQEAVGPKK
jgi:hypothetical protein